MSAIADKQFRIVDYFPRARLIQKGELDNWEVDNSNSGGLYVDLGSSPTTGAFLYRSELDIAGWTKEGLTAFFASIYTQRPLPYATNVPVDPALGGVVIQDQIIVTDVPMSDALLNTAFSAGFPLSQSDYMTIKLGLGSQRVQTINAPTNLIENDAWSFGSKDPTASDTLYLYRYILVTTPATSPLTEFVDFPILRFVAEGVATEEPEFVYLTRLRRSYELREQ